MPELGKYEKIQRPESVQALIKYLQSNPRLTSVAYESGQILQITRNGLPSLKVFMTNIYVVGEAEAYEILSSNPDVNAIVTMSAWNGYSRAAKNMCKIKNVGLFKFEELLGAIYYEGQQFLGYIPPTQREQNRRRI
ncbi:MAG TPA: hypothetical protein ACFYEK_17400 [Candidatus Wunengus sp. YC60]|uniref:hypothetical protein n=1 Tax=Candidatus Wunengus sp. YC60 TaxID=3367697 RepID=UPI004026E299